MFVLAQCLECFVLECARKTSPWRFANYLYGPDHEKCAHSLGSLGGKTIACIGYLCECAMELDGSQLNQNIYGRLVEASHFSFSISIGWIRYGPMADRTEAPGFICRAGV